MKKLLILDKNSKRREQLAKIARQLDGIEVDARSAMTRADFETGCFSQALVHYNNDEGPYIESGWAKNATRVVLFSGGFVNDCDEIDGVFYTSEQYLVRNLRDLIS